MNTKYQLQTISFFICRTSTTNIGHLSTETLYDKSASLL